jgi:hypothetical protein
MRWRRSWFIIGPVVVMLGVQGWWLSAVSAETAQGAKALFYTEGGTTFTPQSSAPTRQTKPRGGTSAKKKAAPMPPQQDSWLGVAYWVELERPGGTPMRIADPTRYVFSSGDRSSQLGPGAQAICGAAARLDQV